MVTHPELARLIRNQYAGRLAILYDRVLRHCKIVRATLWNIKLNVPARSMKGILLLCEDFADPGATYNRDTEAFYNPNHKGGSNHRGRPQPAVQIGGVAQWLGRRSVAGGLSLIYA